MAKRTEEKEAGTGLKNQLKTVRTRLGLSQQELAHSAGITRQTIGGIEASLYAPSASVALRLARALGCPVEELFWLGDEAAPTISARLVGSVDGAEPASDRVLLGQVGGEWVAHPLDGERAFRSEMVPADGVAQRRVARKAKPTVDVTLLDSMESLSRTVLIAGCAPALSLWTRSAQRWHPSSRASWVHANSTQGLEALARGEVHMAGVHLCDMESNKGNEPHVSRLLPNRSVVLVNFGVWEEGLVVRSGNPKGLRRGADLAQPGVTLVNRELGSGSRLLLDELLQKEGVLSAAVRGYETEVRGHQEVARTVASGAADVGVSSASIATAYGLSFVPLREVRFDLALLKVEVERDFVRQLLDTLGHRWVRSQLQVLGGYDTSRTGEIVAEI